MVDSAKVAEFHEMGFEILNKPKNGRGAQVNIVKKMSYIWVKNVVVFINQRVLFPVSEARFKLSFFLT